MLLNNAFGLNPGSVFGLNPITAIFWNRTGATLLQGEVAMVDFTGTEAESTTIVPGADGSRYQNLTACTQIGVDCGNPVVVCANPAGVADNASGVSFLWGHCDVACLDDDASSTTDVEINGRVALLVSESAVRVQGWATAAIGGSAPNNSGGARFLGVSLQAGAASSSDTDRLIDASAHLRTMFWTGGMVGYGCSDS